MSQSVARVSPVVAAPRESADHRHLAAVRRSLGWAQDAAQRGAYAEALGWVQMVEAAGGPLPANYVTKRRAWSRALAEQQARHSDPR